MLCPEFALFGNGDCDEVNNNIVCQYDGGDCTLEEINQNCTNYECIENSKFDPCPKYKEIRNGQCNKENLNLICSFDAGDCEVG